MSRATPDPIVIRELETADDIADLEPLLLEYFRFICGDLARHFDIRVPPDGPVANMLAQPERFLPPKGRSFVAEINAAIAGMVFLKPAGEKTLEIKRLYVRPESRGTGLGRRLTEYALEAARDMGATRAVLDSTKNLEDAIALYQAVGFDFIDPYPSSELMAYQEIVPHAVFMGMDLTSDRAEVL